MPIHNWGTWVLFIRLGITSAEKDWEPLFKFFKQFSLKMIVEFVTWFHLYILQRSSFHILDSRFLLELLFQQIYILFLAPKCTEDYFVHHFRQHIPVWLESGIGFLESGHIWFWILGCIPCAELAYFHLGIVAEEWKSNSPGWHSVVNITNILWAFLWTHSVLPSFYLLTVKVCYILAKGNLWKKLLIKCWWYWYLASSERQKFAVRSFDLTTNVFYDIKAVVLRNLLAWCDRRSCTSLKGDLWTRGTRHVDAALPWNLLAMLPRLQLAIDDRNLLARFFPTGTVRVQLVVRRKSRLALLHVFSLAFILFQFHIPCF